MLAPPCQLRLNQPGSPQASSAFGAETCGPIPPTGLLSASEEAKRTGSVETVSSRGNWVVVTVLCHMCSKWRSSHPGCSSCSYGKPSLRVSWQDIPRPHWQVGQPSSLLCSLLHRLGQTHGGNAGDAAELAGSAAGPAPTADWHGRSL
jgi:hypothetical protein